MWPLHFTDYKMGIIPAPHYWPMRGTNIVPILQMRKLRLKEVREQTKMHSQALWMPGSKA